MTEYREITEPVVPQYVADWYEVHKDNLEWHLGQLSLDMMNGVYDSTEIYDWLKNSDNKPIQTLVNMHQFGYKVKEQLYTAKHKWTGEYLRFDKALGKVYHIGVKDIVAEETEAYHFTKDKLIKYLAWENDVYDVKEVKE